MAEYYHDHLWQGVGELTEQVPMILYQKRQLKFMYEKYVFVTLHTRYTYIDAQVTQQNENSSGTYVRLFYLKLAKQLPFSYSKTNAQQNCQILLIYKH
jgi:hypothetical protein